MYMSVRCIKQGKSAAIYMCVRCNKPEKRASCICVLGVTSQEK